LASKDALPLAQGKKAQLPEATMQVLASEFFHYAKFDPVADRLVDTRPPPLPFGTARPPSIAEMGIKLPTYTGGPRPLLPPQSATPRKPAKLKPPGFA
jgi:hypothetical protein